MSKLHNLISWREFFKKYFFLRSTLTHLFDLTSLWWKRIGMKRIFVPRICHCTNRGLHYCVWSIIYRTKPTKHAQVEMVQTSLSPTKGKAMEAFSLWGCLTWYRKDEDLWKWYATLFYLIPLYQNLPGFTLLHFLP